MCFCVAIHVFFMCVFGCNVLNVFKLYVLLRLMCTMLCMCVLVVCKLPRCGWYGAGVMRIYTCVYVHFSVGSLMPRCNCLAIQLCFGSDHLQLPVSGLG